MPLRVLQFSLALLPDRICYLPNLTRQHCVRIANCVLQVLFGSKESFLLVLSALQASEAWDIGLILTFVQGIHLRVPLLVLQISA